MIALLLILISTYPWPIRQFGSAHSVSATLGDARGTVADPRFHRGIDIPAGVGTDVFSITSTDSAIAPAGYDYVRVGDYYYDHLMNRIREGDSVTGILDTVNTPPTQIGDVMDYPDGDHFLVVGKVILIHYKKDLIKPEGYVDEKKVSPTLYFGKDRYVTINPDTLVIHRRK